LQQYQNYVRADSVPDESSLGKLQCQILITQGQLNGKGGDQKCVN